MACRSFFVPSSRSQVPMKKTSTSHSRNAPSGLGWLIRSAVTGCQGFHRPSPTGHIANHSKTGRPSHSAASSSRM